ncbi:MAG: ion transporter [Alphaproteobacteria bacterium]|nr:ion transporter [Alphaproteobacteria bacterium]
MNQTQLRTLWADLPRFFKSRTYEFGIVALIAFNAVLLAFETIPSVERPMGGLLEVLNHIIVFIFVIEIALKMLTFRRYFWRDAWNWFDLIVVAISVLPASEAFASLRALRALRLLRLVAVLPSLRRVVEGFLRALPRLGSIMLLLLLLLFIFSVMGTKLFGDAHPETFGWLGASAFSLFGVMTLEGWPDLARAIMQTHPVAWVFFITFIVLSSWVVLNLVIGVVVDSMQSYTHEEELELEIQILRNQELMRQEIAALRSELVKLRAGEPDKGE